MCAVSMVMGTRFFLRLFKSRMVRFFRGVGAYGVGAVVPKEVSSRGKRGKRRKRRTGFLGWVAAVVPHLCELTRASHCSSDAS